MIVWLRASGRRLVRGLAFLLRSAGRSLRLPTRLIPWLRRLGWRRSLVCLLGLAFAAGVIGGLSRIELDTSVSSLLPRDEAPMHSLEAKNKSFGADPVVALLESAKPRQLLVDKGKLPKLVQLEGKLARLPGVASVYGPGTVLNQIASSAKNMLASIGGRRHSVQQLAERQARARGASKASAQQTGKRALAQFDLRYGQFLVRSLPAGLPTLYNPNFVQTVIFGGNGEPKQQWRVIVPNQNAVALLVRPHPGLSEQANRELIQRVRGEIAGAGLAPAKTTLSGVPVVSTALADTIRSVLPWLAGLAMLGCGIVLALVPRRGGWRVRLWPLTVMAASAATVLASFGWVGLPVSVGVLALLPILLGVGTDFPLYLIQGAARHTVLVVGLASAAAAGCLAVCPLPIVRQLGLALAAGIVLVLVLCLLLARWGLVPRAALEQGAASPPWRRPRRSVTALVLAAAAIVAALGWVALPKLEVNADPQQLASGLPAIDDAAHVQSVLGSAEELSVVVRGPDVLSPQTLAWYQRARNSVISAAGDQVRPLVGAGELMQFLGNQPNRAQVSAALDLVPRYLTSAVITPDRHSALMVFGMGLQDVSVQRAALAKVGAAMPPAPPGMHTEVAGLPVAAARAYDIVSGGRYLTTLSGILGAGVVLVFGLRRRADAGRAVLAGVLATGWGLAILWIAGGSLTPLTVGLGALTTAVGCEFTVFVADARRTNSRAMFWGVGSACANSAVGYLVLTAAGLTALRDFGLLLAGAVVLSYLSALLVIRLLPGPPPRTPSPRPVAASRSHRLEEVTS
ncbi:hypothetical protein [Sciscionella marina]|uniref:hypothetical protein n=1 Tax=Sciscionella marina TaxID=508770 RepID=UPI00037FC2AE|nr:hypothetical protein [Sciscionella marina]